MPSLILPRSMSTTVILIFSPIQMTSPSFRLRTNMSSSLRCVAERPAKPGPTHGTCASRDEGHLVIGGGPPYEGSTRSSSCCDGRGTFARERGRRRAVVDHVRVELTPQRLVFRFDRPHRGSCGI